MKSHDERQGITGSLMNYSGSLFDQQMINTKDWKHVIDIDFTESTNKYIGLILSTVYIFPPLDG